MATCVDEDGRAVLPQGFEHRAALTVEPPTGHDVTQVFIRAVAVLVLAGVLVSVAAAQTPPPDDYSPLPTIGGISTESRVEPRFSKVATTIAGRTVDVRCYSPAAWTRLGEEWDAYVGRGLEQTRAYVRSDARHLLHLDPTVCASLVKLTYKLARPGNGRAFERTDLAAALHTLTHEAYHSKGNSVEIEAECFGLQRVRPAARMLGVSKDYAAQLAAAAWKEYRSPGHPYVASGCRNGGRLDLNPRTNVWP